MFSGDGSKMLLILSQDQGNDAGGYRHIVQLVNQKDATPQAITKGKFVVTEILGWDETRNLM